MTCNLLFDKSHINYLKYKILNKNKYPCLDINYIQYIKNCSNELLKNISDHSIQTYKMLILFEEESGIYVQKKLC